METKEIIKTVEIYRAKYSVKTSSVDIMATAVKAHIDYISALREIEMCGHKDSHELCLTIRKKEIINDGKKISIRKIDGALRSKP